MDGGVYLLDKAAGITSRAAAMAVAKANGFRKFGHCGTLDPDATGLLVVVLGKATRLAPYISGQLKRYSFEMVTGILTDTLDMSGSVLKREDCSWLTSADVVQALDSFTGTFRQRVPLYSAVRVGGKRGYARARSGESPDMPERSVTAMNWVLGGFVGERIRLETTVSAGTYVRALARDIGELLGIPAVADKIRRTEAGKFSVEEASERYDSPESFLSMAEAMRGYPKVVVSASDARLLIHGNSFRSSVNGLAAALDDEGNLLAVGNGDGNVFQPKIVLKNEVV